MKRYFHIDFLRAAGILAVIAIHVLSDNLKPGITTFLWNYLHIIIVAFVFCSGYVMYAIYAPRLTTFTTVLFWYKKRLIRLLLPFYWYLLFHLLLLAIFPKFFSGLGLMLSSKFIFESMTLMGGINLNWLALLFIQLAILFPLLVLVFKKTKIGFWFYCTVAFLITVGFTIWQFPYSHYRAVMWIPWSLFLVLPWYFVNKEKKKFSLFPYSMLSLFGLITFGILYILWMYLGRSLTLIDNKYPPNFFYISYEVFGSFLIILFSQSKIFQQKIITQSIVFLSKVSYSLFFIHYIVFDFVLTTNRFFGWQLSVWYQLPIVILVSCGIALVLSQVQTMFTKRFNHQRG